MKQYIKVFITSILFLVACHCGATAQQSLSLGLDAGIGNKLFLPNGKRGLGIDAEYLNRFLKQAGIRASIGYMWFDRRFPGVDEALKQDSIKGLGVNGYHIILVPVRVGYQQFLFKTRA